MGRRRLGPAGLLTAAAAILIYVARLVDEHTVKVVDTRHLLPRWDLATHLGHGWMDYHLLATGHIFRLAWDLWLQGYWPPALSIFQVPFYLVLGGTIMSGLRSTLAAFVIAGLAGCVLLWRQWKHGGVVAASAFLALLISSPYLLAYASVTMTETVGAMVEVLVLLAYQYDRERQTIMSARLFAISLTVLFFTKYNYFFLLAVPLVLHECLVRIAGLTSSERIARLRSWARRALSSWTIWFVAAYAIGLLIVLGTGGFDLHLLGKRISVHTIGNSGYVLVYVLLARLWHLHHRGRIDWTAVTSLDPRVRPLLMWFALPVTIWLASPYPNHIRDFANLVINRPLGESSVEAGVANYVDALRDTYFFSPWLLIAVIAAFVTAAVSYRRQRPLIQWLVLAIPFQFAAIAIHQTRFPRFLLLSVVLLCVVAASEVGRWFDSRRLRVAAGLMAVVVPVFGVVAATRVIADSRFRDIAFENYTDHEAIRAALDSIRGDLTPQDRLATVGQSNELSPALLRWQLGPPSGVPCFPFEIGGAQGRELRLATKVLLIMAIGATQSPLDETSFYLAQRQAVLEEVTRGDLTLRRELPIEDRHISFRLYDRVRLSGRTAPCE